MIGFIIWSLFGVFIIGLGIKDMFSKKPVGFWDNTETIKVKEVKVYWSSFFVTLCSINI